MKVFTRTATASALILALQAPLTTPLFAQETSTLEPALITAIENANTMQDLMRHIATATAPEFANICTQNTWEDVEFALDQLVSLLDRNTLNPTVSRSPEGGFIKVFAWGPSFDDQLEDLNPKLGYNALHFWITLELADWGTDLSLKCNFAALDESHDVLRIVGAEFLKNLPDIVKTAHHVAPMLDQVPDQNDVTFYQSIDRATRLELRSSASRIDVTLNRNFE